MGRPVEAVTQYDEVIARDDGISVAWSGLGMAQVTLGRLEQAEGAFHKSLGLSWEGIWRRYSAWERCWRAPGARKPPWPCSSGCPLPPMTRCAGRWARRTPCSACGTSAKDSAKASSPRCSARWTRSDNGQAHYNLALDALQRGQTGKARDPRVRRCRRAMPFRPGFSRRWDCRRARCRSREALRLLTAPIHAAQAAWIDLREYPRPPAPEPWRSWGPAPRRAW